MKKLLSLIFVIFIFANVSFAYDEDLGFRGPLNFIQCQVLEYVFAREIHKTIGGNVNIKLTSYGAKALRNGIFKDAVLDGKNLNIDGISISRLHAKTLTENNRLDISDLQHIKLITDILAEYYAELTNEDINTILKSEEYQAEINKINTKLSPFLKIYNTNIYSENNMLYIKLWVTSDLLGTSFVIKVSTDIYSEGYKTGLNNIQFSKKLKLGISDKLLEFLDKLNPVNFVIKVLENAKISTNVKSINIIDDKIQISGIIKLYKDK